MFSLADTISQSSFVSTLQALCPGLGWGVASLAILSHFTLAVLFTAVALRRLENLTHIPHLIAPRTNRKAFAAQGYDYMDILLTADES
jgi:hypothetical protein